MRSRNASTSSSRTGQKSLADVQRELITVDLAFYDNADRFTVLVHPDARVGPDAGAEPEKSSLKGMIGKLTGLPASKQRLLCHGHDVSDDLATLRKIGISHESVVTVYERKDHKKARDGVVLACTAKRLDKQRMTQQQNARRSDWVRDSRRAKKSQSEKMMPKWGWGIPPDNTKLGIGYNNVGKNSSFRYENHHIWYDQVNDRELNEIRTHPTYAETLDFASPRVAPHCQ
jgi:hypothetical protein